MSNAIDVTQFFKFGEACIELANNIDWKLIEEDSEIDPAQSFLKVGPICIVDGNSGVTAFEFLNQNLPFIFPNGAVLLVVSGIVQVGTFGYDEGSIVWPDQFESYNSLSASTLVSISKNTCVDIVSDECASRIVLFHPGEYLIASK